MTTALVIIQAAYREGNLIPKGTQPDDDEITEAVPRLNAFVQGTFGAQMGENFRDWLFPGKQRTASAAARYPQFPMGSDYLAQYQPQYPPVNSRIVFGSVDGTLWFPEAPLDGARMACVQGSGAGDAGATGAVLTLDGNGRLIQDPADMAFKDQVALTAPISVYQWLYRSDLGQWLIVQDMAEDDEMPFPSDLDDLWICWLAIRLSPRYGKTTAPETANTAKTMMTTFKARYRQAALTTYNSGDIPSSLESYMSGNWFW